MNLEEIIDGMRVRITAGGPEHPLHGHTASVVIVFGPLPDVPPRTLRDQGMSQIAHRIESNMPGDQDARAYRKESLEQPFAWPHGQVHLSLDDRAMDVRKWPFPYIVVSPDDIEPA